MLRLEAFNKGAYSNIPSGLSYWWINWKQCDKHFVFHLKPWALICNRFTYWEGRGRYIHADAIDLASFVCIGEILVKCAWSVKVLLSNDGFFTTNFSVASITNLHVHLWMPPTRHPEKGSCLTQNNFSFEQQRYLHQHHDWC